MADPVYLDNLATTPLDPRVRDAMLPWLDAERVGNPHANNRAGWRAAEAVEEALAEIAALVSARPGEVVLTSGATEANDLAMFGASRPHRAVVVSAIEHPSVLELLPALREAGRRIRILPVGRDGRLADEAPGPLEPGDLVSVMAANNEIGACQELKRLAQACRSAGARFHSDATQLLSTQAIAVHEVGVDLLSLSAHKLYGPQGIGALVVRDGVPLAPRLQGGGQQRSRRGGTVPVALAVGFGVACNLARKEREADRARIVRLRERLAQGLAAGIPGLIRTSPDDGLAGCLHVTLPGVDAEDLLLDLPEISASTGSACASGHAGPSHVLAAIGFPPEMAHGSIRFGLGRFTTEAEIDHVIARFIQALAPPLRRKA